ncbi:hypothetical protein QTI33_02270 [Variovorax sp. J22P271]|uniref:hypothetical protein n=1 Tax=Variovorax davisae TaxID=3053515 RepID=UPI00257719AB|nr:hypothetical protein [Variovorax sp. J22P271]MDM0030963.1 hypothetical protein [Variovorax sp. J22P271]
MKQTSTEIALLESALLAIEKVLAHADSELHGTLYLGPTANLPLEALRTASQTDEQRFRASAAQTAANICLSSAAALVDVSQALLNRRSDRSDPELEREWQALITHTKIASRSAYRAALIMAAQRNVLQAQGVEPAPAGQLPSLAH